MPDQHPNPHDADDHPVVGVVVVAAGMGTRLGMGRPKALVEIAGATILEHALHGIADWASRRGERLPVVVVGPPGHLDEVGGVLAAMGAAVDGLDAVVVPGGAERADSVAAGLEALPAEVGCVLVHDAARCFTPPEVFGRVVEAVAAGAAGAVPGLAVVDTVKEVAGPGAGGVGERVVGTPDRSGLRAVQTPQAFDRTVLARAHGTPDASTATDDAVLLERLGAPIVLVQGSSAARKITVPEDLRDAGNGSGGPVLVVLTGPPAVGRTTLAGALEASLGMVRVRVDTIEAALHRSGEVPGLAVAGYAVALALAAEHLAAGRSVVADMVDGAPEAREAWAEVAREAGAPLTVVEMTCTDPGLHRARLEARTAAGDFPSGQPQSDWSEVQERAVPSLGAEERERLGVAAHIALDMAVDDPVDGVRQVAAALRRMDPEGRGRVRA